MSELVERAYRYRVYLTPEQEEALARTFGCCRWVYNYFLNLKQKTWKEEKRSLSYAECSQMLTKLKTQFEWLKEASSVCLQQSLRHLDRAFTNFFQKRAKFPNFKKKRGEQKASFMKTAFRYQKGEIFLAKQSFPLNIRWSRRFQGEPTSLTISKDSAGRAFVSILVKERVAPLPLKTKVIGIDLGLRSAIIDDQGNEVVNPRFLENQLKKLQRQQRSLSRKMKGSNNRQKQVQRLARLHARIRDKRTDHLHQQSHRLIDENQVIAAESLQVKLMQKSSALARSIGDAGWSTFLRLLEYKSGWYGKLFVQVDRYFPSSKLCSCCGHCQEEMPLEMRHWRCPICFVEHDRDKNAARNILKEGLRLLKEKFGRVPWDTRDLKPVELV